ncbi:MAG TPA: molybdenum ABC transporter ATP-binding protein [Woeseiaceae bacterium]|nr:molybdenum ABC transporter ATP-binding protein [Woeseiaceae bacterium]
MSEHIAVRYRLQRGDFSLDVDADIPMRGITGVFGESGAGKTALLRCIAGLEGAAEGRLVVADDVWQDDTTSRPVHRREVGYVFQEPRLFAHLDVRRNIEYGKRRGRREDVGFDEAVELLGLRDLLERRVDTLSGGEAQRVAIARALLRSPRVVLMDEPIASLDRARRDEILPFLDRLHAALSMPVIYVSHSIEEVIRLCDYLLVMERGRVIAAGNLEDVLLRADLPLLGGEEAGAIIHAEAIARDVGDGLTRIAFDDVEMWVPGAYETGTQLRLRIRANDVSLCREDSGASTVLNVLPASIESIREDGESCALVQLAVGTGHILARITRRSRALLQLEPGDRVLAQIKSVAVKNAPAAVR